MMYKTYRLLTGATGLLGRYLLRDLLCRNQRVAVLVRPCRFEAVEQRVDQVLAHWEQQWGRLLPRPVLLCGDITEPLLGLDREQLAWAGRHCGSVLHSAASLTFNEEGGEPYRSNVEGVRNVLAFCREAQVPVLEYLSTAYVAGRRCGVVLENELDVGQEFANDYEKSKLLAETLIRNDEHLAAYTVFRPSIIVGDYRTAYTSTFHGFYAPLRIGYALLSMIQIEQLLNVDFLALLNVLGPERKNLVPVDWVSEAIVTILERRPPENRTYALVSESPVTVRQLLEAFAVAPRAHGHALVEKRQVLASGIPSDPAALESFKRAYVEQFETYRSYWRDDPEFDCTNTRAVLPDLPCPVITPEVLQRLCQYAIDVGFGWPRTFAPALEFSTREWLRGFPGYARCCGNGSHDRSLSDTVHLRVTGPGGGDWTIVTDDGALRCCEGQSRQATTEVRMGWTTFRDLAQGTKSLDESISLGQMVVCGDRSGLASLAEVLQASQGSAVDRRQSPPCAVDACRK